VSIETRAADVENKMILRLWRGWTTPGNADRYQALIQTVIFPGILAKSIAGLEGLELFRRPTDDEVEFITLMRFGIVGRCEGLRRSELESIDRAAGCAACLPLRRRGDAL
jgi:hypothetical protein